MKVKSMVIALVCGLAFAGMMIGCDDSSGRDPITASAATYQSSTTSTTFTAFSSTTWTYDVVEWSGIDSQGAVTEATIYYDPITGTTTAATDAFDTIGLLHIQDDTYGQPYNPQTTGVVLEDSDRELVLPAQNLMGIDVERKLYANPTATHEGKDAFMRWLEILTNNTTEPITVNVVIGGDLGSDDSTEIIGTADGDLIVEDGVDNWFITGDDTVSGTFGDPIVGHLLDGSLAFDGVDNLVTFTTTGQTGFYYSTTGYTTTPYTVTTMTTLSHSPEDLIYSWTGVTLATGETKIIMHLEILTLENTLSTQSAGLPDAIDAAEALESAPASVVAGMDADEINAVVNWPAARNNGNVLGVANSVTANTLVTVTNVTQDTTAQSYSLSDGSFGVCIDAAVGDQILVDDGTTQVTVTAR